ncbi:PAS domain S-box protein [Pedobacter frigiditerrae]|uniref:histidine kinase n=1 Tax=Pedobacter frigiditerrae TaxID=2530452 RepID=A0A4V2MHX2_9SPHI|nr:HAMP domain-containing sensor histidine kinase [Pedobacter frigiditerrae]TCC88046.1 PAS domain S-box protein [Pedobacter frigiditerrae]
MQTRLELYQLVTPLAELGIWERNLSTGKVFWNEIIRQILEVDEDFQPGSQTNIRFYKDTDRVQSMIESVIESGKPQQAELEMVTALGNAKWVKVRMHIRSNEGSGKLLYGTLEDVTAEVDAKLLLQEREQRFSKAFNYAPIGMALVSLKGEWLKANPSLCGMLGYSEDEFMGRTFQEITFPEDLETDLEQMSHLLARDITNYSLEKRYYHKNGHIIWALLNVSLVRDERENPLYFISQIKDITEQKKNTGIIEAQNGRLLNFAHIVSHNLRSHAGNIYMLAQMILGENDQAEKDVLTGMLADNADSLLNTLDELNEIVKINNEGTTHRQVINLRKEIERTANILAASIRAEGATVTVQGPEDISILFNPSYFESVFINLISNSLKYRHPDRPPIIAITVEDIAEKVQITVADNGIGLDMVLHGHKLFGMYKAFHGNADARGMGLFLIRNQIEAMGGSITAHGNPGEGMTFTIEINKA